MQIVACGSLHDGGSDGAMLLEYGSFDGDGCALSLHSMVLFRLAGVVISAC